MTGTDDRELERELRDHYRSIESGSPGRLEARVAEALDRAPARRWRIGWLAPAGFAAAAAVAAAVLAVILLPLWYGPALGPAATPRSTVSPTPAIAPTLGVQPTPVRPVAVGEVEQAVVTRDGAIWTVRGTWLFVSQDHGDTWHIHALPSQQDGTVEIGTLAAADADHAWVVAKGIGGWVAYRTTDGGASWLSSKLLLAGTFSGSIRMTFADDSVGFVTFTPIDQSGSGGPSALLRSTDGGATWATVGSSTRLEDEVVPVDANTLWVGASSYRTSEQRPLLRVSHDGGATWTIARVAALDAMGSADLFVAGPPTFLSASEGYVAVVVRPAGGAGATTDVYRTRDGGATWAKVAGFAGETSGRPLLVDATHWYFPTGSSRGIEITADGGTSWRNVGSTGPATFLSSVKFWSGDAQRGFGIGSLDPRSAQAVLGLYATSDGGVTWTLEAFSNQK